MVERRLASELRDLRIRINEDDSIRNLIVDEHDLFEWKLTIFVTFKEQYDIQINFPSIYLFISIISSWTIRFKNFRRSIELNY
jgi:hypothetical protein